MRKFYGFSLLLAAFGFLSAGPVTLADDEAFDLGDSILAEDSALDIGGWVQFGYTNKSTGLFNSHPHAFNNHQSWLYLEKAVDGSEGLDIGGRVDFMYGVDAADTQSFGNNPGRWDFHGGDDGDRGFWANHGIYGFALPQAYIEIANGDFSVKAGHFFTLLGYEVVPAPDNFFYSHAFTMYNSEAFTHTGVLGTYQASDNVTVYGGWTLGWDTGFDQFDNGSSFLGGFSVGITDDVTFTYITTFGDFGAIGEGYSHSMVLDIALTDNLNYIIQSDLLQNDNTPGTVPPTANETVGINQYLIYNVNDKFGVGGRMEWWKSDSNSIYAATMGVNIKPVTNLIIRPELRYQWDPGTQNGVLDPTSNEKGIFGVDAILTF